VSIAFAVIRGLAKTLATDDDTGRMRVLRLDRDGDLDRKRGDRYDGKLVLGSWHLWWSTATTLDRHDVPVREQLTAPDPAWFRAGNGPLKAFRQDWAFHAVPLGRRYVGDILAVEHIGVDVIRGAARAGGVAGVQLDGQ
jgi:hypothetical protein